MFTCLRRLLGILILVASLGLLAWALWPAQVSQAAQSLTPDKMQLPVKGSERPGIQSVAGPPPAVPEKRRVVLDYPVKMREGDADVIRLTLEADAAGNVTPTAIFEEHATTGESVQIPNVYDTHSVQVEASLDLPNATVTPAEAVSLPLQPGQKASFTWTIKPGAVGTYRGAIWLTLRFTPLSGGEEVRQALTSLPVEVQVVNLVGIGGPAGRIMGIVGSALGSVIGLDDVFRWLFRRKKKTRSRRR